MFEALAGYLEVCATPEQSKVCLDACTALADAGITEHAFLIEQQLASMDNLDSDAVMGMINGLLIPIYANQLSEFGVVLSDDASLAQYVDVLQALNQVDNYDDPETLQGFCESTEGSQVALADILAVLGEHSLAEDYLPVLAHVNPSLLERISQVCNKENADELPSEALVQHARERLAKLMTTSVAQAIPELLINLAVEEGARLGMSFKYLIDPYLHRLEPFGPNQLAVELLGFACASDATDDQLLAKVRQFLPLFLSLDSQKITTIDVLAASLIKQVTNA